MKPKILMINGSYREGGVTDQIIDVMGSFFEENGVEYSVVLLRERDINFCSNCRSCMQESGEAPGMCIHYDEMPFIVEQIEASNGFVLASPTNVYCVTALFKRFLERLAVYGYWPWGQKAPTYRKRDRTKRALLVSSCAAPAIIGRLFTHTMRLLKETALIIGAKPVDTLFVGLVAEVPNYRLSEKEKRRARKKALALINTLKG